MKYYHVQAPSLCSTYLKVHLNLASSDVTISEDLEHLALNKALYGTSSGP